MSKNKNYTRGRAFEYAEVKGYRERGWTAWRSAGSHGPADVQAVSGNLGKPDITFKKGNKVAYIWIFHRGDTLLHLVQCKTGKHKKLS